MSTLSPTPRLSPAAAARARLARLNHLDKRANLFLKGVAILAAVIVSLVLVDMLIQIIDGASLAINTYGLKFVTTSSWNVSKLKLGGLAFIYGTLVTSLVSLFFATILGIACGLCLALMAPRAVSTVIGPLIELLAAVPTVILGLIGILVIAPFSQSTLEPLFHSVLGFIPLFGQVPSAGQGLFTASLVLTIMVVPIIASLSRDIFITVPQDLMDGAEALGCTRWEMIRGVVLPTTKSGVTAACVLGFGRAIGEAIAVTQVVGGDALIHANLFLPGTTIASAVAEQFESSDNGLETASFFYMILILFAFSIITNLISTFIRSRGGERTRVSMLRRATSLGSRWLVADR